MSYFEKVSFERWKADCGLKDQPGGGPQDVPGSGLKRLYDSIILPRQATSASAGCDFSMPFDLELEAGGRSRIATGIRWVTDNSTEGRSKVLLIVPRSGLGFRYGIRLSNTVGVIDADYCDSDNEGHIIISLENPSSENVKLPKGKPFAQGIIVKYEIPEGAESPDQRNGGFGSTDR